MPKLNKPEAGKQYRLTGAKDTACIANGDSWAASEVQEIHCCECGDYISTEAAEVAGHIISETLCEPCNKEITAEALRR